MVSCRDAVRSRKRLLLTAFAATLFALTNTSASSADSASDKDKLRLDTALAHLEAQMPLTSADHNALKKAAVERQLSGLRVCGDPGNLPLSDVNRAGYENKIIELIAAEMGTFVTYFWRPYLDRGITRQTFDSGECDVLLDLPADSSVCSRRSRSFGQPTSLPIEMIAASRSRI